MWIKIIMVTTKKKSEMQKSLKDLQIVLLSKNTTMGKKIGKSNHLKIWNKDEI